MGTHPIFESDFDCLTDMAPGSQYFCHRCNRNVEIDPTEKTCRTCSLGFIEEVRGRTNDNPPFIGPSSLGRLFAQHYSAQAGAPPLMGVRVNMSRPNATRGQRIQIGNASTMGPDARFASAPWNDHEQMMAGHRNDIQNMIQNINLLFGGGLTMGQMGSGTFSMEDYAWGATGLDDIITQVLA